MKPSLLTAALFCLFFSNAIAQKYYTTTLRKANGREVFTLDSADFISVIYEPDPDSKLFNVKEFYKDKTPKLEGKSKSRKEIMYEGLVRTFYCSGKKHELITYMDGAKVGDSYEYYPNGKIYTHKKNIADEKGNSEQLLDCRDSTGEVLAAAGEGKWRVYGNNFSFVFEEGTVKNALREGEWKGDNGDKVHNISFTEQYSDGVLKSGNSVYADDNKTYTYTARYVDAQYPGGMHALDKYVNEHGRYPASSRINDISGSLMVQFSILTDGTLSECKVTDSPDISFSNEAVRLLQTAQKWTPAYAFGRPIKVVKYSPVIFGFSERHEAYITINQDNPSFMSR
ncbi:TonB family protein [Mucilaginibacter sp. dw_454]|uniref:TonB family protein n=1 Tax=Mucilaginibacter sp. dw_454 TaxID=2720079 RepID=UPI001BD2D9D6|nr:TonB family protein [Mucilaginibacter sp. dw_454]